ncbi:MAG: hypothetical protein BMS9Abin29_0321 [Gemmatimonadota bacterium]|nr:MAG: hypothetical protein BMS9Abin29_0321 [Gemmatimonadota bacterium]
MMRELGIDPVPIDVGGMLQRSVATLYSHLVTRPTGRAVRLAIESQLAEVSRCALSLIDLSEVTVLDFSCADEVVAKLLLRFLEEDRPGDAYFVLRGLGEQHREPITTALERQNLLAVAQLDGAGFELIGARTAIEESTWETLEEAGHVRADRVMEIFPDEPELLALAVLVERRVVVRHVDSDGYYALSALARDLPAHPSNAKE